MTVSKEEGICSAFGIIRTTASSDAVCLMGSWLAISGLCILYLEELKADFPASLIR